MLYIDADACPVKEEAVTIALRHQMAVMLVSNRWHRGHDHPLVSQKVVPETPDAADDWIASVIQPGDLCLTNDIPLAARCLTAGAKVLTASGREFTQASIGQALATRDLMSHLRESGEITGGPPSYSRQHRQDFLNALERLVVAAVRSGCR